MAAPVAVLKVVVTVACNTPPPELLTANCKLSRSAPLANIGKAADEGITETTLTLALPDTALMATLLSLAKVTNPE